jgi:FMN hydrolase / 5-amino-6-(5-phospho-D-ribitylamino)uracil phosphatase
MTYFFDVMSTLIYDPFLIDVPKELNQDLRTFLSDKDRYAWIDFELGNIDEAEFARRFSADGTQAYTMRDIIWNRYRWLDGMQELLLSLRAQGHTICTLSNYPSWYHELDRRVQLSNYVDHHFVSYKLRARKPSPEAYTIPLKTMKCTPEHAIFIDDRPENCEAAQRLGIRAIQFHNAPQLKEEL